MLNLKTGKEFCDVPAVSRRDFGRGLAAILAAGVAPSIALGAIGGRGAGGVVRGAAARAGMMARNAEPYDAEVEYLQSSGSQRIDTEIYGSNLLDFDIQFYPFYVPTSGGAGTIFGARKEYNQLAYQLTTYKASDGAGGHFDYYNQGAQCYAAMTANVKNRIRKVGLAFFRADGTTRTLTSGTWQTQQTICLYCLKAYTASYGEYTSARIYYVKFSNNGTLVRDFVPVRVGSTGYMYDRVSGRLFGNSGTGAFIVGPDKT